MIAATKAQGPLFKFLTFDTLLGNSVLINMTFVLWGFCVMDLPDEDIVSQWDKLRMIGNLFFKIQQLVYSPELITENIVPPNWLVCTGREFQVQIGNHRLQWVLDQWTTPQISLNL